MSSPDARQIATDILDAIIYDGAYSQVAIDRALQHSELHAGDRAFCVSLVYGTLTYRTTLDALLDSKLKRGLNSMKRDVRNVFRLGAYQILYRDDVPQHAAVNEAVNEARSRRGQTVGGIANGVLRNIVRERDDIIRRWDAPDPKAMASKWGIPTWMGKDLVARVGKERADRVMEAFNLPTPVRLRVRDAAPDRLIETAWQNGARLARHPLLPTALVVEHGSPRELMELLGERVAIEDAGAQFAVSVGPDTLTGRALDVCAGRGVKTLHIADRYPNATVVACDKDAWKLEALEATFGARPVTTEVWGLPADAPDAVQTNSPYEYVLVDAPCSGLGTMGRHPEIRARRTKRDIRNLARLQSEMLASAAGLVSPGGWLTYVVCTWTQEEGPDVVKAFLESDAGAEFQPASHPLLDAAGGVDDVGGVALWPDEHESDGFYVAPLRRTG